jgi:hypothetical protein
MVSSAATLIETVAPPRSRTKMVDSADSDPRLLSMAIPAGKEDFRLMDR